MRAEASIPTSVDAINRDWFATVVDKEIVGADVLAVIHGTATKVHVELEMKRAAGAVERRRVWVKTGLEPHSKAIGNDQVYAGETLFYRLLGGRFETRTPACLFADSDAHGNSVLVLDDLCEQGAVFMDPLVAASPDFVAQGLESIARYQAASWMSPELQANSWLRQGGAYRAADVLAWLWNPDHWDAYATRPRFQHLDPALRDRGLLERAHRCLQDTWWPREPWTLCHGDAHYGQSYVLPGGEVRLLDWQCVQAANWAHDMSYFLVSALSVDDRRRHARDLVAHHVKKLREFGVTGAPDIDAAYEAFRAYAFHGIGWVMCLTEMQPEDVCAAMTERFSAAVVDLGSIERILG